MDRLFQILPQWAVVLIILALGIVFFYITMPPHTVCDSQIEIFQSSQTPFLYLDPKKTYASTTAFQKSTENCKLGNSHGACRELFDGLRKMVQDIKVIPSECYAQVSDIDQITSAVWGSLGLFTQLAWGERAPASSFERMGWFDSFHLHTYCQLKRLGIELYGESSWNDFANKALEQLPQASQVGRNEAWARSILSINCAQYR